MCCLFGFMDYGHTLTGRQKNRILSVLASACEVRSTDATGIAYNQNGKLCIYKRPLAAHRMRFRVSEDVHVVMGHTRMTTQGSEKQNYNNHPFYGRVGDTAFALAHNGVLFNDRSLKHIHSLPKTNIETDSYVAVQLIEKKEALDMQSLKFMAEQVEGSFTFTVLDQKDSLYIIKGNNPLCLYHDPGLGLYIYASTEEILRRALSRLWFLSLKPETVKLYEGDILQIHADGGREVGEFHSTNYMVPYYGGYGFSSGSYVEELRNIAHCFGYSSEDIDNLLDAGFTTDEIEEHLYEQAYCY